MTLDQARVIIRSVNDLPDDLGPGLIASAETLMIGHCSVFDPTRLALIGRRLAECVDPDGTQARDEKKHLEREKTARNKRGLMISQDKGGAGRFVRGYLDTEGGAIIVAALDGLSASRGAAVDRRDQAEGRDHHPPAVATGQNRCRVAERRLPAVPEPEPLPRLRRRNHPLLRWYDRGADRPGPARRPSPVPPASPSSSATGAAPGRAVTGHCLGVRRITLSAG